MLQSPAERMVGFFCAIAITADRGYSRKYGNSSPYGSSKLC